MNDTTSKNWIALKTILEKEITRFLRIWSQTLIPPAITMSLYFIIFGQLIGSQIRQIEGFTYMQFIVPGLVLMTIMTNAYSNTSTSFFGSKFSKSIEEMLVSSMPNYIILWGFTLAGALRGLLAGVIVFVIALFFTHIHFAHPGIVLGIALLSAFIFSLGGLINGILAIKFDDISFIPTFVLTPLTYLGGIFYSLQQLPPFWQKISVVNPILGMVDTFRYGMLGISDLNVFYGFFLVISLFILLFILALILLNKGVGLRS